MMESLVGIKYHIQAYKISHQDARSTD